MGITIMVAMTKDRVIGAGGELPWHIADDMRLFRDTTSGGTVIMGKTTWLSIPEEYRPLPDRQNIIVSKTLGPQEGAKVCKSVEDAIKEAEKNFSTIFCIGGAQLYKAMLPMADKLCISWIKEDYEGDTHFPDIDLSKWKEVQTKEYPDFVFKKYEKI